MKHTILILFSARQHSFLPYNFDYIFTYFEIVIFIRFHLYSNRQDPELGTSIHFVKNEQKPVQSHGFEPRPIGPSNISSFVL